MAGLGALELSVSTARVGELPRVPWRTGRWPSPPAPRVSTGRGRRLVVRAPAACDNYPCVCGSALTTRKVVTFRPQIRRDNPLNLSISLGGGKETNQYSLSNGE